MGWTNSNLFTELGPTKKAVIQTVPMKAILDAPARVLRMEEKIPTPEEFHRKLPELDEQQLENYKRRLLSPFLGQHKLFLYDWPISGFAGTLPLSIQEAVNDILQSKCPPVYLSKRISDLDERRQALFNELQQYEEEALRELRRGRMQHVSEYLPLLQKRQNDHREIDMELAEGIHERLDEVLKYRDRFGSRRGWNLVQRFFEAYHSPDRPPPQELKALIREIETCLYRCRLPTMTEQGREIWRVTKALVGFIPYIGTGVTAIQVKEAVNQARGTFAETLTFFRSSSRERKKLSGRR